MYYKRIIICLKASVKSHETYWILKQFHPILSANMYSCIWQSDILSLKRAWDLCRFFANSYFNSSVSSLVSPNTNMSGNPHKNKFLPVYINFMQHTVFVLAEDGQYFFSNACKADGESEKNYTFTLLKLICLFESRETLGNVISTIAVSYTHLTLPTRRTV